MRITINIILLFTAAAAAYPDTIKVPGDHAKIQSAISAAKDGDTVIVAPGKYFELIDFLGKAITVRSTDGPEVTIIDGSRTGSTVTFQSAEGPDSILEGFTVTNGSGTPQGSKYHVHGGGIFCYFASPTITGNIIELNSTNFGGGISCFLSSDPVIVDNIIRDNRAGHGAGIHCMDYADPLISGNKILDNTLFYPGYGGGIYGENSTDMRIEDNIISGNSAGYGGGVCCSHFCSPRIEGNVIGNNIASAGSGGGIFCRQDSNPVIKNNVISENTSNDEGGGIWCWLSSAPLMINNLICKNTAVDFGGAIYCSNQSSVTIINNTIAGNTSGTGGGGLYCVSSDPVVTNTIFWNNSAPIGPEAWVASMSYPSTLTLRYGDVKGGQPSVFVDSNCTLVWGAGMISAEPLFLDAGIGDYHIRYVSPCRNAGSNKVKDLPDEDFEGDPRIVYGVADIGADEFHDHLYHTGTPAPGGYGEIKITGTPKTSPLLLWIGSGVYDPPQSTSYGDWYLQFPLLLELSLGAIPDPGGILVLPHTFPPDIPTPWDIPVQALIGNQLSNLFVIRVD